MNGSAEGLFAAPHADAFSWMVLNGVSREPLTVTITTEGLGGTRAPFGDAALLAAALALACVACRRRR